MPCILSTIIALVKDIFLAKRKKNLEKELEESLRAAERVNPPPQADYIDYTDRASASVDHLLDEVTGDGLWRCCRGHEQELIHYKGPHPFKRLTCYCCQHILCRQCCTTDVLTLLEPDQSLPASLETSGPLPFGQICLNCGLSHRAKETRVSGDKTIEERTLGISFGDVLCVCGHLADKMWLRFRIGPIYQYRRNPHEAFAGLSRQRADSSVKRQMEGVVYS